MSSASIGRLAVSNPSWIQDWQNLDNDTARKLESVGLRDPLIWAGIRTGRQGVQLMLESMGVFDNKGPEIITTILDGCMLLQSAAQGVGESWVVQIAGLRDEQVAMEAAIAKRARVEITASEHLQKLAAAIAHSKPVEWRSKKYRRAVETGDEKARRRADEVERRKWTKRIFEVITSAGLPFGQEAAVKGWTDESPEITRILAGLRATTLRKRFGDFQPFRRWLKSFYGLDFPVEAHHVLTYFAVRSEELAARTVYRSLLLALKFFEVAGDVPAAGRLSGTTSLENAAKEYELKRRRQGEEAGEAVGVKQAQPLLVAVLVALEKLVVNQAVPRFIRGYAWYRLAWHWTAMRFSDGDYLAPASLQKRARGVMGILTRTKTSGVDKKISQLPIFISNSAWIEVQWLDTGLELWQGDLGAKRDYFLPLPSNDFQSIQYRRARYTDAQGFSKALLGSLECDGGEKLLLAETVGFWSEHSDRSGLVSWLSALGVPEELRRFVGRWAATGSAESYVRSALRIVENAQKLAAKHAKAMKAGGADYFGEEEILSKLRDHVGAYGVSGEVIDRQIRLLTSADASLDVEPLGSLSSTGGLEFRAVPEPEADEYVFVEPEPAVSLPEEPASVGAADEDAAEEPIERVEDLLQLLDVQESEALEVPQGFVVSVSMRGRCRRLHFAGGCFRVPGEHFKVYESYGQACPAENLFTHRCKDCFPSGRIVDKRVEDEFEMSDGCDVSSSSSSSSSEAETSAAADP